MSSIDITQDEDCNFFSLYESDSTSCHSYLQNEPESEVELEPDNQHVLYANNFEQIHSPNQDEKLSPHLSHENVQDIENIENLSISENQSEINKFNLDSINNPYNNLQDEVQPESIIKSNSVLLRCPRPKQAKAGLLLINPRVERKPSVRSYTHTNSTISQNKSLSSATTEEKTPAIYALKHNMYNSILPNIPNCKRTPSLFSWESGVAGDINPTDSISNQKSSAIKLPNGKFYDPLKSLRHLPYEPIYYPPLSFEARHFMRKEYKTPKFKLAIYPSVQPDIFSSAKISSDVYMAGGEMSGVFQLKVKEKTNYLSPLRKVNDITLGEIGVELIGFEENYIKGIHKTPISYTFLLSRGYFQKPAIVSSKDASISSSSSSSNLTSSTDSATQSPTSPTSSTDLFRDLKYNIKEVVTSAVAHPYPPPDVAGYREPEPGTHLFPWKFALPFDLPSSGTVASSKCQIKYIVSGFVKLRVYGTVQTLKISKEVQVVEAWDIENPVYKMPSEVSLLETSEKKYLSKLQKETTHYPPPPITFRISTQSSLIEAGSDLECNIEIRNEYKKKIAFTKCALMTRINLFGDRREMHVNNMNDLKNKENNNGHKFDSKRMNKRMLEKEDVSFEEIISITTWQTPVKPGEQKKFIRKIPIPNNIKTIRNTALFSANIFLRVYIPTQSGTVTADLDGISVAHVESLKVEYETDTFSKAVASSNESNHFYTIRYIQNGRTSLQEINPEVLNIEPDFYDDAWDRVILLDPALSDKLI